MNGENVLYHYLHKDLYNNDIWLFQMLSARLVTSLGIWFKPEDYARLPIMIPFVVRDPDCRKKNGGNRDSWGEPNDAGLMKDDNTLIKALPKALQIESPLSEIYQGKKLGNGFVASHVWRKLQSDDSSIKLSSRNPLTNSFIPNLVWLPVQVSKLTDREGSFTQLYIQALSKKLYMDEKVHPDFLPYVKRAWDLLPDTEQIPPQGLPERNELTFFSTTEAFFQTRMNRIEIVIDMLKCAVENRPIPQQKVFSKYSGRIRNIEPKAGMRLLRELAKYLNAVRNGEGPLTQK